METDQYIGVDLHKSSFQVCAITPRGERLWEARFARTPEGIAAFVARCTPRSAVAVEATTPTWHFVDQITAHVATVCVVDTRKTKLKAGYAARPIGWMRDASPMRCGARAWSAFTCRRRRSANSANWRGIG